MILRAPKEVKIRPSELSSWLGSNLLTLGALFFPHIPATKLETPTVQWNFESRALVLRGISCADSQQGQESQARLPICSGVRA